MGQNRFDIIIAGGGAAGLGLAYQILHSPLKELSILIAERDEKRKNDRTWCFWVEKPFLYDSIVYRSWDRIAFTGKDFQAVLPLQPFQYKMIRGIDFYDLMRETFARHQQVQVVKGEVQAVEDGSESAAVTVDGETYRANWVFDSIIRPGMIKTEPGKYHYLKQHFKGWEIETGEDCFDPGVPTLFDFRTPQDGRMRFLYILPHDARRALVEYTLFSADLLTDAEYRQGLKNYLEGTLGIRSYRVIEEENGVIPMTDQPFPRRLGQRVMAIGTKGGRVKPSSGYAFLRMAADAERIVQSLARTGSPFSIPQDARRYRFYDRIMLQLMYRQGGEMKRVFTDLFKYNPVPRVFRFLNEQQPLLDDMRLMATLPIPMFLKAMLKVYLLRAL